MWPFTSTTTTTTTTTAPTETPNACPVDHDTRAQWLKSNPVPADVANQNPLARHLSTDRQVSTIPRWLPASEGAPTRERNDDEGAGAACPMHRDNVNAAEQAATVASEQNWVYPSPASFYTALERKQRNPRAEDMDIVVPIHNAVNERVWQQVLDWERHAMGLQPGQDTGSRLVSFVGKPKQMTPRARWKSLIGYTAPFDRHDWIVDRPLHPPTSSSSPAQATDLRSTPSTPPAESPESIRVRYVIDFYTGRGNPLLSAPPPSSTTGSAPSPPPPRTTTATTTPAGAEPAAVARPEESFRPNLAFFIDCRPALDGWEGARMRFNKFWGIEATPPSSSSS
ncbi:hypothetical protein BMF94_2468 [Rhodotorula taiwanensis]|uniref:Holocytochrome c-type synthase n=1 Tax=Rhodotorula taiwanensis TaxID=741276 RepID=A0A2S5BCG1_9BASI|nr:hypothetical protein BMF94_2468 [Rhodotorula taiwanensis]